MKNIHIVSKEWSPINNTGLGFSSTYHENILNELNIEVVTVGLKNHNKNETFELNGLVNFLFNFRSSLKRVDMIIEKHDPDLILVESLQTILSEIFLARAYQKKIKTGIISHGVSIYPYARKISYLLRYILWLPYIFLLKKLIKNCHFFMSLSSKNGNHRNYDTQIALKYNKEILEYNNFSRFESKKINFKESEKKNILCLGYINHIKNQIDLIKIAKKLNNKNINIKIIYNKFNKIYFDKNFNKIKKNNLSNIFLLHEKDIELSQEIYDSWLLINTSITEVSPLSLIEGNSLNKIFLSYNVGNLNSFKGNIINNNIEQMIFNLNTLNSNSFFKEKYEQISFNNFKNISPKKDVKIVLRI